MIRLFWGRDTFGVNATAGVYLRGGTQVGRVAPVGLAGGLLLAETARAVGMVGALVPASGPFRRDGAVHDPGETTCDLVLSVAAGGDCLLESAQFGCESALLGLVAWFPMVSRLFKTLLEDIEAVQETDHRDAPGRASW